MKRLLLALTLTCTMAFAAPQIHMSVDPAPLLEPGANEIQTFYTPFDHGQGEQAVLGLIDRAKIEIHGNAYGLTDPEFVQALIDAHDRGVEVVFTVDKTQAAGPHQAPLIAQLRKAGCDVQVGKSPDHSQLLHLKAFEVDQEWVEDGSWNYSPSANEQLNVINLYHCPERAKQLRMIEQLIYDHVAPTGPHASQD